MQTTSFKQLTHKNRYSNSGFTLLEMMMVLTLMVILMAIAMPSITAPLAARKVQNAADLLRAEFGKTRVEAMESGQIRMFRFQRDTGSFSVQPWITGADLLESDLVGLNENLGAQSIIYESADQQKRTDTLPEGVRFLFDQISLDMRSYNLDQDVGGIDITDWSRPVLFYPDGTTSDAKVFIQGDDGTTFAVMLRGLTGIARIEEVEITGDTLDQ